jgi:hypothetical protein
MEPRASISKVYALRCSRTNLWAVVALSFLGTFGLLAPAAATRSVWFASGIPVDRRKVEAVPN